YPHGDRVGRLGMYDRELDELREYRPELDRVCEHAQARHLDVDGAADEQRSEPVERSSELFEEVNRRQFIRVHSREGTQRAHVAVLDEERVVVPRRRVWTASGTESASSGKPAPLV